MSDTDTPQDPAGTPESADQNERASSRILLIAAALFGLAAVVVVGFLISSRDDDADAPLPGVPDQIDLAAPLLPDGSTANLIHLIAEPVHEGENTFEVHFTSGGEVVEPADPGIDGVDLTLAPLANADAGRKVTLSHDGGGIYSTDEPLDLTGGWWEITATIFPETGDPRSTIYYLLLPDPNINTNSGDTSAGDSGARSFFEAGLARIAATHSIKYIERLTSGDGAVSIVQREITSGVDGAPAASHSINAQFELLTIGDQTFQRVPGGSWFEREFLPVYPVSEWVTLYDGATGFELAESVMVNGRTTQIITFYVPQSDTLLPAWYAWWVDAETGYVIREAMISTWHYMIYEFGEFNQPLSFDLPLAGASPVASPLASPAG
jgi:hypothetical protein